MKKKGKDMWHLNISKVPENKLSDLSYEIHKLQDECGAIKELKSGIRVGEVLTGPTGYVEGGYQNLTASILREKGYDVSPYHGCGHCLQDMPNTGGRCDCECHN